MAIKAVLVVFDDEGDGWDDFQYTLDELNQVRSSFESGVGLSRMQVVDVPLPGDPEWDDYHEPSDEVDFSHSIERLGMALDKCLEEIAEDKN